MLSTSDRAPVRLLTPAVLLALALLSGRIEAAPTHKSGVVAPAHATAANGLAPTALGITPARSSAAAGPRGRNGGRHMVAGVPYHGQVYTEDCETAALQMALAHEGIRVTQAKLLRVEGVSRTAPVLGPAGRVLKWGNPNTSFVGYPNSSSIGTSYGATSGYGTYAPNIARVAARFGATVLWQGTGFTRGRLERAIAHDHPVIAWVGDRDGQMFWSPLASWRAWDGRKVVYPAPSSGVYEHTVLVVGFGPKGVFIDDPLNGARSGANVNPVVGPGWVSWKSFLAGFRTFHGMAVELQ